MIWTVWTVWLLAARIAPGQELEPDPVPEPAPVPVAAPAPEVPAPVESAAPQDDAALEEAPSPSVRDTAAPEPAPAEAPPADTAPPPPLDTGPVAPVPSPAPAPPAPVDDSLFDWVGPPPLPDPVHDPVSAAPEPLPPPPIVWQGPPLLEPLPAPPAPELVPVPVPVPVPVVDGGLEERVASEVRENVAGLERLLTTWTLLGLLLVLGIAVAGYRLAVRLADAARDAGYDLERRLVGLRVVAAAGAALWGGGLIARQLLERVPLLGLALVGAFLAGVVLVLARQTVQAVGGMVLVLGARVREGDRLTVGEVSGTVEHAGFLRLRLRRPDGSTVFVPTHALDRAPVTVSSPRRTQAVRVPVPPDAAAGPEGREAVRRKALLCPFRQAGSEVRFERTEGEEPGLEVVVQAWSASAAEEAERWLRRALG